ncbi:MAG TPA: NADH-quinone oxidoreductase subunit N [Pyrinomonadaceae bacterium]|jgi:NADH-quinone oxidoreductase subunit N
MNAIFLQQLANPEINFPLILPETIVAAVAAIVMLIDCFAPRQRFVTSALSIVGLLAAGAATIWLWTSPGLAANPNDFNGMMTLDALRLSFTLVFLLVSICTILISEIWVTNENVPAGEYHSLLLFATVGMMLMASGNDLVILFLGLETLSIATYVLAGLRRTDLRSNESSLKYFILGSFSSAFLLYGMALVYGATGSTNITIIASRLDTAFFPALLLVGAAMMLIGFGFKIAAAPFHVWTPDVYEGAPTPITSLLATGSKAAGFAAFLRVFIFAFPFIATAASDNVSANLHTTWLSALSVIAMITMVVGNVAAIVQNNIKRMLAYSSIAHAGYALVGFVGAGAARTPAERDNAIAAVAFYMLAYAITSLGAFAVVTLLAQKGDRRTEFEDYTGIGFRAPVLAFTLSLFMLSLFGLPLTAGFTGKILVFRPALDAGFYLLVIVAVINTAISAYYYLRLIVVMFFRERTTDWALPRIPASLAVVLILAVIGVLGFGIFSNGAIRAFQRNPAAAVIQAEK